MRIIGLTGSIGMGKSTVAGHIQTRGFPVFDADTEVHRLYAGSAVTRIERRFPGTTSQAGVDRPKLARALNNSPAAFKDLEAIVHPLVRAAERTFLHDAQRTHASLALLDIPLLFEGGNEAHCDAVIVVSAAPEVQRARVLARPGMTAELFEKLLKRQMPDAEKCARADFVVDTNGPVADTLAQTDAILERLKGLPCTAFDKHWK